MTADAHSSHFAHLGTGQQLIYCNKIKLSHSKDDGERILKNLIEY